ncbi:MAG: hypothetical protein HQL43_12240 [Alphaproteobacteria bacterium]|nr:hypothetical protein [Alphaproteobacteria bacterium]
MPNPLRFDLLRFAAALLLALSMVQGAFASEAKLNILVISSFGKDPPAQAAFEQGLEKELGYKSGRSNVYFEFLDSPRLSTENAIAGVAALIEKKYRGVKFDAVVAWALPAARLVSQNRHVFADCPVIFLELTDQQIASLGPRSARDFDLAVRVSHEESLKEALRLSRPKRIVLIGEAENPTGAARFEQARRAVATTAPSLVVEEIADRPLDEVIERASNLPPQSMIYYLLMFSDGRGTNLVPFEVARRITEKANAPLFTQWESLLGSGSVGGYQLSIEEVGRNIGKAVQALSRGEPVLSSSHMRFAFDWRQLTKWGWDDVANFPPETIFLNRPPDLLKEYRWQIATILAFILALLALSVSLARALHARHQALAALASERKSLAEKVQERTAELARSNQELESFAYAVSHDLRAPVRSINSFAQLLERRFGEVLTGDGADFLSHIMTSARGMDAMILGLLDFSRAGHQTAKAFEPADLSVVAEEVVELLQGEALALGGRIELSVAQDLPPCRCNRDQIRRLLQNLVENALKYRSPERPPLVRIMMSASKDGIAAEIHDNGIGIPENRREKVFGLFQRDAPASVPGYGIGLALCKRIVEVHGGKIWLVSEPGGGCCFNFSLPLNAG